MIHLGWMLSHPCYRGEHAHISHTARAYFTARAYSRCQSYVWASQRTCSRCGLQRRRLLRRGSGSSRCGLPSLPVVVSWRVVGRCGPCWASSSRCGSRWVTGCSGSRRMDGSGVVLECTGDDGSTPLPSMPLASIGRCGLRNRLFLQYTRPLGIFTRYVRRCPTPTITPVRSQRLVSAFCTSTLQPARSPERGRAAAS